MYISVVIVNGRLERLKLCKEKERAVFECLDYMSTMTEYFFYNEDCYDEAEKQLNECGLYSDSDEGVYLEVDEQEAV